MRNLNDENIQTGTFHPPSIHLPQLDTQPIVAELAQADSVDAHSFTLEDRLSILTQKHKIDVRKLYGTEQQVFEAQTEASSSASTSTNRDPAITEFFTPD